MNNQIVEYNFKDLYEHYNYISENTYDCIWLYDIKNQRIKYVSPSIQKLRGYTVKEAMEQNLKDYFTPESFSRILNTMKQTASNPNNSEEDLTYTKELQMYCKDGTIKDVESTATYVFNDSAQSYDVLGITRDITPRKKAETALKREICEKNDLINRLNKTKAELIKLTEELQDKNEILKTISITDSLTKIYNRRHFDQKVIEETLRAERYGTPISIILFDLDDFKAVNDKWGHDVGDNVLIKISDAINKKIKKPDVFARWGGEEFVLLLPQTSLDKAADLAEKYRKIIEDINHKSVGKITASFGIAEKLPDEPFETWFKRVDLALYRAKIEGKNKIIKNNTVDNMPIALVRLSWRNDWECGDKTIDDQHKNLLNLSNEFIGLSLTEATAAKTLDKLDDLIKQISKHFEDEEEILKQKNYPNLDEHKKIHAELVEKTLNLKTVFLKGEVKPSAFFSFLLDDVITGHLIEQDKLFFPYFKKQ